jgi:hypothetical protein
VSCCPAREAALRRSGAQTLTAPEGNAPHHSDLAKRPQPVQLGRVWGADCRGGVNERGGVEGAETEGCLFARFRVLRFGVHHRPPMFMTSPNRRPAAAGERPRTGVNEPKTEPRPRSGDWADGTAGDGPRDPAPARLEDATDRGQDGRDSPPLKARCRSFLAAWPLWTAPVPSAAASGYRTTDT